ncbi:vacuolar protein sorting 36 [Arctopsyche grandis]|uniref:vacuolar protein sorting 36 n=1 Tax=Arctopsyche grandis TaxID=121162 RepID=UPI00406D9F45
MNRFEYVQARLVADENYVKRENRVTLYDGDDKTQFANGELVLTSHRILWGHPGDIPRGQTCLSLNLHYVFCIEEESSGPFGLGKSKKVLLHLNAPSPNKNPGPVMHSAFHYIKLSFKEGLDASFIRALNEAIQQKSWEVEMVEQPIDDDVAKQLNIKTRFGIVGIERSLQEKQKATDESISIAFQDLSKLMTMAKDMVSISKTISTKIREKQGDITEDDTIRFKSYLMSLGIDDPVTRDTFRTDSDYYKNLSQQISDMLVESLVSSGGMMALADVWCRINRARGLELISPEDLLNACRLLETIGAPMSLRKFPSGACVIQLNTHDDNVIIKDTSEMLKEGPLSAEELSQKIGVSVLLAKERLLTTETAGLACRDDSDEGLKFYKNLFIDNE